MDTSPLRNRRSAARYADPSPRHALNAWSIDQEIRPTDTAYRLTMNARREFANEITRVFGDACVIGYKIGLSAPHERLKFVALAGYRRAGSRNANLTSQRFA